MQTMLRRAALAFLLFCGAGVAHAQVSITTLGVPYSDSFDTLPASGSATWTNNSTIPGWFHARTGTGTTIVANNGSSNAGNLYSYGTGTATDRALGSLGSSNAAAGSFFWGVRLQNNTGSTITSLTVSFTGEQWRNSAAAAQTIAFSYLVGSPTVAGSLAEFQSAGVAVPALDFTSPITGGTAAALDGNLAANRVALSTTITGLSIPSGTEVMLRWSDPDHSGSDHGLSIDEFSVTAQGAGGGQPAISINDISQAENDAGTSTYSFTVSLSQPAGAGGVSFDVATADGTATTADGDYLANSLTGQVIPAGASSYSFDVTVNGDTTVEPSETFLVNLSNVTGAVVGDAQGTGTIVNDDVTVTPIHDIQGSGASSPLVGQSVTTTGIVTGRKSNGFFVQAPDASADADPLTSEGIFVFTGAAPPAAVAAGNQVQVSGKVVEFVPNQDPLQPPLTEIGSVTGVTLLSSGNPLPTPVALTTTFPDPAGGHDQLERVEGMRVSAASLTVVAPTGGFTNEPNATGTSNGVFHVVVTGIPRPFREPGIQAPDPAPPCCGTIPPIPRWDANPELIAVDSDVLGGAGFAIDLSTGALVTGLVGPLDYSFRRYTIARDPNVVIGTTPGAVVEAARVPLPDEFTVATYNFERFFDTVNDPGIGEPVLTAAAFDRRLGKASLAIRDYLHAPDILAAVEVENLNALQALADRVNADAVAASQPDPQYAAYLVEGNDVGGIDVGFLVKGLDVGAGIARVEVGSVTQENAGALFVNPDSSTELLNDRPPLRLSAVVHYADGRDVPVTVIAVHQRSLNDAESNAPGSNGWATVGERVRAKRQAQAENLANLVQSRQAADPDERILVLGDFNAFEFNDGLTDALGVVSGLPSADAETAVPGDGVDLVDPDLINLNTQAPADQRYTFMFGGNAQSIDHALANQALLLGADDFGLDYARINADFPEVNRNDGTSPSRLSDHDPVLAYFAAGPLLLADLSITATGPKSVPVRSEFSMQVSLDNAGPDAALVPAVGFALDYAAPDMAITAPAGWACDAAQIANGMTSIACTSASLAANAPTAVFQVSATAPVGRMGQSVTLAVVTSSETEDPNQSNNQATATIAVLAVADLSVVLSGPSRITRSTERVNFVARMSYGGPDAPMAPQARLTANLPRQSVSIRALEEGWSCIVAAAADFDATCTANKTQRPGAFVLTSTRPGLQQPEWILIEAEVSANSHDPQPANDRATLFYRVGGGGTP